MLPCTQKQHTQKNLSEDKSVLIFMALPSGLDILFFPAVQYKLDGVQSSTELLDYIFSHFCTLWVSATLNMGIIDSCCLMLGANGVLIPGAQLLIQFNFQRCNKGLDDFNASSNPENLLSVKQGKQKMNRGWSMQVTLAFTSSPHLIDCRSISHECDGVSALSRIRLKGEY